MLMSDRAESFLIFLMQGLWPNNNIDKAQDDYACEGNSLSDPGGRKEGGAPRFSRPTLSPALPVAVSCDLAQTPRSVLVFLLGTWETEAERRSPLAGLVRRGAGHTLTSTQHCSFFLATRAANSPAARSQLGGRRGAGNPEREQEAPDCWGLVLLLALGSPMFQKTSHLWANRDGWAPRTSRVGKTGPGGDDPH